MDKQHGQKILAAGATLAIAEPALAHFSGPGVIAGLAASAGAYFVVDAFQKSRQSHAESKEQVDKKEKPGQLPLAYRLFNGKSVRSDTPESKQAKQTLDDDMDVLHSRPSFRTGGLTTPRKQHSVFLFSDVLEHFTPSLNKIYLATLEDGTMVFCKAEDLCHIALAGTTQNGKTSLQRMIVAQLCYAGARVLILNPHWTRYRLDKKEDWTPFEGNNAQGQPYLLYPPMECKDYAVIAHYLHQIAEVKLKQRLERFAYGEPTGKPYYVVLDELPDIVKKVPEATGYLDDILRQGAKVGIFLICASQDFLVKTLKMDGGAVRACYRTALYVGSGSADATTGHTLLNTKAGDINESILGRGTIMIRNWQKVPEARLGYAPLMDNEALYNLLGPSTYVPGTRYAKDEEDSLVGYMVSGDGYEDEDRHTETLPTQTRRHVATSAYDARKRQLAARRMPVRVQGTPGAQGRQSEGVTQTYARVPEMIIPEQKPEPTINDALAVWNEVVKAGGKLSRYSLRDKLVQRGFDCGENKARDLLADLKAMAEKSVGG